VPAPSQPAATARHDVARPSEHAAEDPVTARDHGEEREFTQPEPGEHQRPPTAPRRQQQPLGPPRRPRVGQLPRACGDAEHVPLAPAIRSRLPRKDPAQEQRELADIAHATSQPQRHITWQPLPDPDHTAIAPQLLDAVPRNRIVVVKQGINDATRPSQSPCGGCLSALTRSQLRWR